MKPSALKILLFFVLLLAGAGAAVAQNGTLTPYSRFGYGMLRDNATATQQSMGGVGYAMNSGRQINVMNPASYARVDSLTFLFDMGVTLSNIWSSEGDLSEHQIGGGLNYITMQFPLAKRLGMSIGILPYSAVGYAFGNTIDNGYTSRQGAGSINLAYAGIAARIVGGLSVGANVAYMFGTTANDTYATTTGGSVSLFEDELTVRDYHIDAGIQYSQTIGVNRFTVGVTYSPAKALHGTLRTYAYDTTADSDPEEHSSTPSKNLFGIAESWGAGINWMHNYRLMVEADVTYQPWSKVKYQGSKGQLADRYKAAIGAQFQPTLRGSYFGRIQYRAGLFATRDYLKVNGNTVREYGASAGFGFPVPGFKTTVNLGFEWLRRQAHPTPLFKENHFNITLGVNINELWFQKSRIY